MISELGKLPSLDDAGENGIAGGEEERVMGACGGVIEGDGRMRGSLGCPSVDRALQQHLFHCEFLLQVSTRHGKEEISRRGRGRERE